MLDRVWSITDAILPDEISNGEPDRRNVGRIAILFSAALLANGPFFIAFYWWLGAYSLAVYVAIAVAIIAAAALTIRVTKSVTIGANQILFGLSGVLFSIIGSTGGFSSPATLWLTLIPAFGMLLAGPRTAIG